MLSNNSNLRKLGMLFLIFSLIFTGLGVSLGTPVSYAASAEVYVSSSGNDTTGDGTRENPYATLYKAYQEVNDEGSIYVLNDINLSVDSNLKFLHFDQNKRFTISTASGVENTAVIQRGSAKGIATSETGADKDTLMYLEQGQLTLKNIIIDAKGNLGSFTGRIMNVYNNSKLIIDEGTILRNSYSEFGGSAIYIRFNTAGSKPVVEMKGGEITGNKLTSNSGTVLIAEDSTFIMSGGTITDNSGGGVSIDKNAITSQLVLSGTAQITGNRVVNQQTELNVNLQGNTLLTLNDDFIGKAGITAQSRMNVGNKFGVAARADLAGLENLNADNNTSLFAVYGTNNTLVWQSLPTVALNQPSGDKVFTGKPVFAGTATPGATITVKIKEGLTLTATADASGNWSVTPETDLPDGTYNVEVTATNYGRTSAPVSKAVEVDTTATTVTLEQPSGDKVFTGKPVFAGTATPGATVAVKIKEGLTLTTTADENGNWSVTPETDLPDDTYNVEVTATKDTKTSSPVSKTVEVNTAAPTVALEQPSGDKVFNGKPKFEGTATPGATITVKIKEGLTLTAIADENGNWSVTPDMDLPNGTYNVEVTATKDTKTSSPVSRIVEVDTTVPAVTLEQPSEDKVLIGKPEFAGTATPGATVTVRIKEGLTLTATADENGNWSVTPETNLPNGTYNVEVTASKDTKTSAPIFKNMTVEAVDTSALEMKANEIKGKIDTREWIDSEYTALSWANLTSALEEANRVLNKTAPTQQEVDQALAALKQAEENLVKVGGELENLNLAGLTDKGSEEIQLAPSFDPDQYKNYRGTVTNDVYGISMNPTAKYPDDTVLKISVNGQEYPADDWNNLPLDEGPNEITVGVYDKDGNPINEYTYIIVRESATEAKNKLTSLVPSVGSLYPAFDPNQDSYTVTVANSVYQLQLTPTAQDPNATIEISVNNGEYKKVTSGEISDYLALNVGPNAIKVRVTDQDGKSKEYTVTVTRTSSDNNGSNGGGSTPVPVPTPTPTPIPPKGSLDVTLNGTNSPFATGTTSTSGGRAVTSVKVDLNQLNNVLSQGKDQQLAIHSSNEGDLKVDGLTADTLKQLADKGASLDISNPLAIYPVPGGKVDLNGVAKQLGDAALNDIAVHVGIARSSDNLIDSAKKKAAAEGYELLTTPVDLDLTFTKDGKTVQSGQLNGYAKKYIALPEGIDPNRITTGVVINPDGSVFHVPTVVTKIDNRYYALINDLRSSGTYSVIWNPQDFEDVKYHWGREDVNNIAGRLDLKGNGDNTFSPNRSVTRSEFAEIVVTGLGLKRQDAPQANFYDVPASVWYKDAVAIANEFDIVRGYNDGNFKGELQITREQGFAMIARAYRLVQSEAVPGQEITTATLARYTDGADVSSWAQADVAQLINAGVIQGNGPEVLSPKAKMTRAEVTALIARMLKVTNLIDK